MAAKLEDAGVLKGDTGPIKLPQEGEGVWMHRRGCNQWVPVRK
jgi:hypothetical protein